MTRTANRYPTVLAATCLSLVLSFAATSSAQVVTLANGQTMQGVCWCPCPDCFVCWLLRGLLRSVAVSARCTSNGHQRVRVYDTCMIIMPHTYKNMAALKPVARKGTKVAAPPATPSSCGMCLRIPRMHRRRLPPQLQLAGIELTRERMCVMVVHFMVLQFPVVLPIPLRCRVVHR